MTLKRYMTQYRRRGDDTLVAAFPLKRTRIEDLHRLFPHADDGVVLSQEITAAQQAFFEERTGESLDLRRFAYFVEPFAEQAAPANGAQHRGRSRPRRVRASAD